MGIKDGYCRTDTDGLVYKRDDTFWLVWPDETGDPGVLDFKEGAIPVPHEEYWEGQHEDVMRDGYENGFYPHVGFEF